MSTDISCQEKPWQHWLIGSTGKLNSLFNDEKFSDLTISFPGQTTEYKAHRLIMAVSSSIFEGMLFGPMAIKGSVLELPDDNPEAFKIVLGSCYEVDFDEPSDIDVALKVYMLADKYLMEQLEKKYAQHIGNLLNSDNINKVLDFVDHFKFHSLKTTCFEVLNNKFGHDEYGLCKMLIVLQPERVKYIKNKTSFLEFKDSWKYPDKTLCDNIVMEILKNNCRKSITTFSGCVSAKIVSNLFLKKHVNEVCLSFTNFQQAKEVISALAKEKLLTGKEKFFFHLQCSMATTVQLMQLPSIRSFLINPELLISDVDDHGIEWVVSAVYSLKPKHGHFYVIAFPKSKLTLSGTKTLITELTSASVKFNIMYICSSEIPLYKEREIQEWVKSNLPQIDDETLVELYDRNDHIPHW